jgi:hypothetical protein
VAAGRRRGLPLTHAVDLLVSLWIGEPFGEQWAALVFLTAVAVISCVVCVRTFKW